MRPSLRAAAPLAYATAGPDGGRGQTAAFVCHDLLLKDGADFVLESVAFVKIQGILDNVNFNISVKTGAGGSVSDNQGVPKSRSTPTAMERGRSTLSSAPTHPRALRLATSGASGSA